MSATESSAAESNVLGRAARAISLTTVDPRTASDEMVREVYDFNLELKRESAPEDPTTPFEVVLTSIRNIPSMVTVIFVQARDDDGRLVGLAEASYLDMEENQHLLQVGIRVLPECRRSGIGTALLARAAAIASEHGRSLLLGQTSERVSAGDAFCTYIGAEAAQATHENRLDLAGVDRSLVARWIADGASRAAEYHLEFVDGSTPPELVAGVIAAHEIMNTAPRGDMQVEDMHVTAEMIAAEDEANAAVGNHHWALYAVETATGHFVGVSDIGWHPSRAAAISQMSTAVHPDHRGHGLGRWMKAEMIERILKGLPEAKYISTGNADSNAAMLAINEALGFRPHKAAIAWQVTVEQVRARLAER